jgi:hypothetical protein
VGSDSLDAARARSIDVAVGLLFDLDGIKPGSPSPCLAGPQDRHEERGERQREHHGKQGDHHPL